MRQSPEPVLRHDGVVGRTETATGGISAPQADMLGATLVAGWDPGHLAPGAVLPPLWHWAAFPPAVPMEGLGPDGHPRLGGFLPDLGLSRRMWAGGRVEFHAPLRVGETLTRRSEIVSLEHKDAASGPMALVTLHHRIEGPAGLAVTEDQTVVYLNIPERYTPPKALLAPEAPDFDERVAIDPVRLFRYSAVTFNGHRIHYDRDYATGVEHYPALVVHGPLQATLLIDAAARHHGASPARFRYRGVHPMFDDHDLRLIGTREGDGRMTLCTAAPAGHQGMQATAEWG